MLKDVAIWIYKAIDINTKSMVMWYFINTDKLIRTTSTFLIWFYYFVIVIPQQTHKKCIVKYKP